MSSFSDYEYINIGNCFTTCNGSLEVFVFGVMTTCCSWTMFIVKLL